MVLPQQMFARAVRLCGTSRQGLPIGETRLSWRVCGWLLPVVTVLLVACGSDEASDVAYVPPLAVTQVRGSNKLGTPTNILGVCGDGIVTMGEACDDGNLDNSDACLTTCALASCGDGYVHAGVEGCDVGGMPNANWCDSACLIEFSYTCNTSYQCASGLCDPTNNRCACVQNIDCPGGQVCKTSPGPIQCVPPGCGNYVVEPPEVCDDGNTNNNDDCMTNCNFALCGDGFVYIGVESCDDGNLVDGDGCDSNCIQTDCGNGIEAGSELCDDGNLANGDGCDSNCTFTDCGNGIITTGEECEDGNLNDTDACLTTCTAASCGDGFVWNNVETCDDGNLENTDDCLTTCTTPSCGDGFVWDIVEACDDSNSINGDGCDSNCTVTACGNGVVTTGEQCDDGNTVDDNGCTAACLLDTDNDTVPDDDDNCPGVVNEQQDANMNGTDDACDCQAPAATVPDVPVPLNPECMEMICVPSTGKWIPFARPDHTNCTPGGYCLAGECIGSTSSDGGSVGTGGMTGSGGGNNSYGNGNSSADAVDAFGPSAPNLRGGGGCACQITSVEDSRHHWFVFALVLLMGARKRVCKKWSPPPTRE